LTKYGIEILVETDKIKEINVGVDPALTTAEQVATWQVLFREQRWALRQREAGRIVAEAMKTDRAGNLDVALLGYDSNALCEVDKLDAAVSSQKMVIKQILDNAETQYNLGLPLAPDFRGLIETKR